MMVSGELSEPRRALFSSSHEQWVDKAVVVSEMLGTGMWGGYEHPLSLFVFQQVAIDSRTRGLNIPTHIKRARIF